jgi:hypothetical protein
MSRGTGSTRCREAAIVASASFETASEPARPRNTSNPPSEEAGHDQSGRPLPWSGGPGQAADGIWIRWRAHCWQADVSVARRGPRGRERVVARGARCFHCRDKAARSHLPPSITHWRWKVVGGGPVVKGEVERASRKALSPHADQRSNPLTTPIAFSMFNRPVGRPRRDRLPTRLSLRSQQPPCCIN